MRGTRVKQLRRRLFREWPMLIARHGAKNLKPYNSVFRLIKKGYNEHFKRFGFEGARTK